MFSSTKPCPSRRLIREAEEAQWVSAPVMPKGRCEFFFSFLAFRMPLRLLPVGLSEDLYLGNNAGELGTFKCGL